MRQDKDTQRFLEEGPKADRGRDGPAASGALLVRCASAAMVGASVLAFAFEGLAYNLVFLARILPAAGRPSLVLPLFLAFNPLWALAAWSYLQAHSRDPGVLPPRWHAFVAAAGGGLQVLPARAEWQPGQATLCRKCERPRPERAHHCCICGTCILRMDHHCPWIGNCVGFHNYKFFLLLGSYASLACLLVLASALPAAVSCLLALAGQAPADSAWRAGRLGASDGAALLLLCAVALAALLFLAHMLSVHAPLAARNLTSIEDFYDGAPNPFDRGGALENLEQVLGACGPDWLLPVLPARPLGDGVSYPRAGEAPGPGPGGAGPGPGPAGAAGAPPEAAPCSRELLWRRRYGLPTMATLRGGGAPAAAPSACGCGPLLVAPCIGDAGR